MPVDIENFKKTIKSAEHHGNPLKVNIYQKRNSSGANGAYQFLDFWKPRIKEYADKEGYTFESMDDFLGNSTLQDDFFEHYVTSELTPQANTLQQYNSAKLSQEQILAGLHFLGYPKMRKVLENMDFDSPQSYKTSLNDYFRNAGLPEAQSFVLPSDIPGIEDPILDYATETPADNTRVRIDTDEMVEPVQQQQDTQQTTYSDVLQTFFNDFKDGGEVSNKIRKLRREGKPQDQAVAIALSMKRRGELKQGGTVGDKMWDDVVARYPRLGVMREGTVLQPDPEFNSANTGVGSIEFLSPNQSVEYPNGYTYQNPYNKHMVVYDPALTSQDVALDLLHGLEEYDPTYKELRDKVGQTYMDSKFKHDFINDTETMKQKIGDKKWKDWYDNNPDNYFNVSYLDGVLRNMLFQGSAEDFKRSKYWDKARDEKEGYFQNKGIMESFMNLENYLKSPEKLSVPQKKKGGMVRLDTLDEYEHGGEHNNDNPEQTDIPNEEGNYLVHRSSDFIYHSEQYPEMKTSTHSLYSSPLLELPSGQRYMKESMVGNTGASCTGAVCKATDDIFPRLGVPGLTKWREQHGFGSGSDHPRYEEYGESVDAWDIQGAIRQEGGIANYTASDPSEIKQMSGEEFEQMVRGFSVGTVLNYTVPGNEKEGLNKKNGMIGGTHAAVVVGFNEDGLPVLFDYANYRLASKTAFDGHYKLVNASTPAEYADLTFDNLAQKGVLNKAFEGSPLKLEPEKLKGKLYSDEKSGQNYNENRMQTFTKTLEDQKENLLNELETIGTNEEYDQLANLAVAIAMAETRGGSKTLGSTADAIGLGDSVGMTQINEQTFFGKNEDGTYRDPVLAEQVIKHDIKDKKDLFGDEKSAVATMIYLATLKNRAETAYETGMKPGERKYRADNSLKGIARGLDRLTIEETGEKINIPSKNAKLDGSQVKNFNEKIVKLGLQSRYSIGEDEDGIYVAKKTVGNSKNLTLPEKIAYYWNTPTSLVSGDAQGRNEYVKKVLNYFNTLQGSE